MGVSGLWEILLTIASKKDISDFSGYKIAIDASLWIMKVNSIFEADSQRLKSIFNKIVWLKKHNIFPIFVFDGASPALKRKTLEERRKRRRQLNDLDIRKKAEIQLLKKIQNKGDSKKEEEGRENRKQIDQKIKQTDNMLAQLLFSEEDQKGVQLEQKNKLQNQLLDKKYEFFCEISETLITKHGTIEDFNKKQFDDKLHLLDEIQKIDLTKGQYRNFRRQLTEEQKIIYDMQLMKKKAKIRQLQDNLYRKIGKKKKQGEFQIIQTIQNGRKLIQKRKIKQQNVSSFGYVPKGKKTQLSNDFQAIFKNKKEQEVSSSEDQGDFFANIFNKDYQNQKDLKENTLSQIKRKSLNTQLQSNRSSRRSPPSEFSSASSSSPSNKSENRFSFSQKDLQLFSDPNQEQRQQINNENPDNFPDFIKNEELDDILTSNDNIQLQNLLNLLNISFLIAPAEAQAQCAALEQQKIVDAVATEDSDVFLFGGRTILRGLFQDNIKLYTMNTIQRKLGVTREKMILLAMMLGSDYTQGIKGIGIVNAMQIVKVYGDIEALKKLTEWARTSDTLQVDDNYKTDALLLRSETEDQKQFLRLHRKYKTYWHVNPKFPQKVIYDAYLKPEVLEQGKAKKNVKEKVQEEVELKVKENMMREKFGMGPEQIRHNMKLLNREFEPLRQRSIDSYMEGGEFAKIRSKRLKKAINNEDNIS